MFQAFLLLGLLAPQDAGGIKDLIDQALLRNPEILAARKKLEAARQKPAMERSRPDPMLGIGYQSAGGPLPGQGLGMEPTANIGFMVSQTLPAAGKLGLRERVALKEADAMSQEYWQAQLSVIARLKTAWHQLHHAYALTGILERNRDLLERVLKVTEARYAVAKAAQQDLLKAQTQLTLLEARLTKSEQEKRSREAEINMLCARPLETPVPEPPDIEPEESIITLDRLYEQAKAWSPMLLRDRHNIERTELALNLARKEGSPDYTVSAGYYNMGSMPPMFMAKVDFNLPIFTRNRQRAAVAEQAHSLEAARRSYQATGNTLLFKIKDDWLMSAAAWKLVRIYSTTLMPQAALTLESSLNSYETGQVDFLTVLMNLMAVLEAEMSYHESLMDYHLSLIRLEEMTGLVLLPE
ncbi:MAG: TolC family protein [Candidatus Solibacter usitatus]|nr:TolC family protein [Candidatus Solibacter usitatus]